MATVLREQESVGSEEPEVLHFFDVNVMCKKAETPALAVYIIRKAIQPVIEELGGDKKTQASRYWAAEEVIKNVLHADESYPREVTVLRDCGRLAISTWNRMGENGAQLAQWEENPKDNGIGLQVIREFADDFSITPDGDMVEFCCYFNSDEEGQHFPRIHHND